MTEGDASAEGDRVTDEVERAGELGREGEEDDVAARCIAQPIKGGDVGEEKVLCGVDTAFGVGEKRAFEVNADGLGFEGMGAALDLGCNAIEGGERGVQGGGRGGGAVPADTVLGVEALKPGKARRSGGHDVLADSAVGVDVKKSGGQGGVVGAIGVRGKGGDGAVRGDGELGAGELGSGCEEAASVDGG